MKLSNLHGKNVVDSNKKVAECMEHLDSVIKLWEAKRKNLLAVGEYNKLVAEARKAFMESEVQRMTSLALHHYLIEMRKAAPQLALVSPIALAKNLSRPVSTSAVKPGNSCPILL